MTVVTDQGATVTLVDSGVFIIDNFESRCGIDENGQYYPIVVNESSSGAAIGSDWVADTGGNPNASGIDYVKIIDGDSNYVNPQLLPWLARIGATFTDTFGNCFMKTIGDLSYNNVRSFSCFNGQTLRLSPTLDGHSVFISTYDSEYLVNCDADGFSTQSVTQYTARCSNNQDHWTEFCNYCLLKALGAPTTIFET